MSKPTIKAQVRDLIEEHWTCFVSLTPRQPECDPAAPCSACITRAEALALIQPRAQKIHEVLCACGVTIIIAPEDAGGIAWRCGRCGLDWKYDGDNRRFDCTVIPPRAAAGSAGGVSLSEIVHSKPD